MVSTRNGGKDQQLPTPPTTAGPSSNNRKERAAAPKYVETPTSKPASKRRAQSPAAANDDVLGGEISRKPKKQKGKGKNKQEDEEDHNEEEDGESIPEDEEEEGDTEVYDPEEEALEKLEESVAGGGSLRRPSRAPISLACSLDSFTALRIGKHGAVPERSASQKEQCLAEFERQMKGIIQKRHKLAAQDDTRKVFTWKSRQWWKAHTEAEVWELVSEATSLVRKIVLGGMWIGLCKYTDLPAPTDEELKQWLVYGDVINDASVYGGSATADPKHGGAFSRWLGYERAKRRSNEDIDVSIETNSSAHLRRGLQVGAVMEIRALAVFDPLKHLVGDVLATEGLFIDFLRSYNRQYQGLNNWHTPEALQASIDTVERESEWQGLNHCSPFLQGIRGDSIKRRVLDAQHWSCELCDNANPMHELKFWGRANHDLCVRFSCKNEYICIACWTLIYNTQRKENLIVDRDDLKQRRAGTREENQRNALLLRHSGLTLDQWKQKLLEQGCQCPVCREVGGSNYDNTKDWSMNVLVDVFPEHTFMCQACCKRHYNKPLSMSDAEFIQDRRDFIAQKQHYTENVPGAQGLSAAGLTAAVRAGPVNESKFDMILKQAKRCPVCTGQCWDDISSAADVNKKSGYIRKFPSSNEEFMFCKSCDDWIRNRKIFDLPTDRLEEQLQQRRTSTLPSAAKFNAKQVKYDLILAQDKRCPMCREQCWDSISKVDDVSGKSGTIKTPPFSQEEVMACVRCVAWLNEALSNQSLSRSDWETKLRKRQGGKD